MMNNARFRFVAALAVLGMGGVLLCTGPCPAQDRPSDWEMPDLVAQFKDKSRNVRYREEDLLGMMVMKPPGTYEAILSQVDDEFSGIRSGCARALASFPGAETEEVLLEMLADPEAKVRGSAAVSLGRLKVMGAREALEELREEADPEARFAVLNALMQLGVSTVEPMLEILSGKADYPLKNRIIETLQNDPDPGINPALIGIVGQKAGGEDAYGLPRIKEKAIAALAAREVADAVEPLIVVLGSGEYGAPEAALKALGKIGDPRGLEPIREALEQTENASLRTAAIVAAGDYGSAELVPMLVPLLVDAEQGSDHGVIALALGKIGDPAGLKPVLEILKEPLDPNVVAIIPPLRSAAKEGIESCRSPAAVPVFIDLIGTAPPHQQIMAAEALGRIGDARALPVLTGAIRSGDPELRGAFIYGLLEYGGAAAKHLVQTLKTAPADDPDFVATLISALAQSEAADCEPHILPHLDSPSLRVRIITIAALGQLRAEAAVLPLLSQLADPDRRIRQGAAEALGLIGDKRAEAGLVASLEDPDASVRSVAVEALGRLGLASSSESVAGLLGDEHPQVRASAATAMAGVAGEEAVDILTKGLSDADFLTRRNAILALEDIGTPAAQEAVATHVGDDDADLKGLASSVVETMEQKRSEPPDTGTGKTEQPPTDVGTGDEVGEIQESWVAQCDPESWDADLHSALSLDDPDRPVFMHLVSRARELFLFEEASRAALSGNSAKVVSALHAWGAGAPAAMGALVPPVCMYGNMAEYSAYRMARLGQILAHNSAERLGGPAPVDPPSQEQLAGRQWSDPVSYAELQPEDFRDWQGYAKADWKLWVAMPVHGRWWADPFGARMLTLPGQPQGGREAEIGWVRSSWERRLISEVLRDKAEWVRAETNRALARMGIALEIEIGGVPSADIEAVSFTRMDGSEVSMTRKEPAGGVFVFEWRGADLTAPSGNAFAGLLEVMTKTGQRADAAAVDLFKEMKTKNWSREESEGGRVRLLCDLGVLALRSPSAPEILPAPEAGRKIAAKLPPPGARLTMREAVAGADEVLAGFLEGRIGGDAIEAVKAWSKAVPVPEGHRPPAVDTTTPESDYELYFKRLFDIDPRPHQMGNPDAHVVLNRVGHKLEAQRDGEIGALYKQLQDTKAKWMQNVAALGSKEAGRYGERFRQLFAAGPGAFDASVVHDVITSESGGGHLWSAGEGIAPGVARPPLPYLEWEAEIRSRLARLEEVEKEIGASSRYRCEDLLKAALEHDRQVAEKHELLQIVMALSPEQIADDLEIADRIVPLRKALAAPGGISGALGSLKLWIAESRAMLTAAQQAYQQDRKELAMMSESLAHSNVQISAVRTALAELREGWLGSDDVLVDLVTLREAGLFELAASPSALHRAEVIRVAGELRSKKPQGWLAKVETGGEFVAFLDLLRLACADRAGYGGNFVASVLTEAEGALESHRQVTDVLEMSPLSGLLALGGDPAVERHFEKSQSPTGETLYELSTSEFDLLDALRSHPALGAESAGLLREEIATTGSRLVDTVQMLEQAESNLAQQVSRAGGE